MAGGSLMPMIMGILESSTAVLRQCEEVPVDEEDTYLDEDLSENDDPYIDEDGNFLANEQIVSDIYDDLALDDEEHHESTPWLL